MMGFWKDILSWIKDYQILSGTFAGALAVVITVIVRKRRLPKWTKSARPQAITKRAAIERAEEPDPIKSLYQLVVRMEDKLKALTSLLKSVPEDKEVKKEYFTQQREEAADAFISCRSNFDENRIFFSVRICKQMDELMDTGWSVLVGYTAYDGIEDYELNGKARKERWQMQLSAYEKITGPFVQIREQLEQEFRELLGPIEGKSGDTENTQGQASRQGFSWRHPVIVGASITAISVIAAAIITSPHWTPLLKTDRPSEGQSHRDDPGIAATPPLPLKPGIAATPPLPLIKFYPSTSTKDEAERMVDLRKAAGLRALDPLESGRRVREVPGGTYFWIQGLDYSPTGFDASGFEGSTTRRIRDYPSLLFEIHKTFEGRISLLGYASREAAVKLAALDGTREYDFSILPSSWGAFDTLVIIPKERFVSAKCRSAQLSERKSVSVVDAVVK